jgi:hypothetical protein
MSLVYIKEVLGRVVKVNFTTAEDCLREVKAYRKLVNSGTLTRKQISVSAKGTLLTLTFASERHAKDWLSRSKERIERYHDRERYKAMKELTR